ncbi:MAG: DUF4349 domain-containing protein [Gemmatimonadota bacterium]|nr:DUF4349 domain-containing protein [Gemmatimonadota bacterium]
MSDMPRRAALGALVLLLACGQEYRLPESQQLAKDEVAAAPPMTEGRAMVSGGIATAEFANAEGGPAQNPLPNSSRDPATAPAMIIRTGNASVQIDSLWIAVAQVRALADRVGGYVANSQIQSGDNQVRSATIELKVPADRFDALVAGLTPLGKVEYVNVSAQDVGEEFTDMTARVANSRRLESRLIELLATRTGKLSDVLEIERELARVREEIERMEGRLRYLRAHVSTSSLTVTVHEKAPIVGDVGSGGVIGDAFRQAWRNFVNFIAGAIASSGVIVPLGALLFGAVWLGRRWWRGRN